MTRLFFVVTGDLLSSLSLEERARSSSESCSFSLTLLECCLWGILKIEPNVAKRIYCNYINNEKCKTYSSSSSLEDEWRMELSVVISPEPRSCCCASRNPPSLDSSLAASDTFTSSSSELSTSEGKNSRLLTAKSAKEIGRYPLNRKNIKKDWMAVSNLHRYI